MPEKARASRRPPTVGPATAALIKAVLAKEELL